METKEIDGKTYGQHDDGNWYELDANGVFCKDSEGNMIPAPKTTDDDD